MNERIQTIQHKGKSIISVDYRGFTTYNEKEYINTIEKATEYFINQGTDLLTLVDVNETYTNSTFVAKWKEATKKSRSHTKKSAVIGITGVKSILLNAINRFSDMSIKVFKTKEEALDWLVNDSNPKD